jgi:hypothetical protein
LGGWSVLRREVFGVRHERLVLPHKA